MFDPRGGHTFADPLHVTKALVGEGQFAWAQLGWQPGLYPGSQAVKADLALVRDGLFASTRQAGLLQVIHEALPDGQELSLDFEVRARDLGPEYLKLTQQMIHQAREIVA